MNIGIPKEIKPNENRFSLVSAGAAALVSAEHTVIVETGTGLGSASPMRNIWRQVLILRRMPKALLKGLNIIGGKITHKKVAGAFGLKRHPAGSLTG